MIHTTAQGQIERVKVICPHCNQAMIVKVPAGKPEKREKAAHQDAYLDQEKPLDDNEEIRFREMVVSTILEKKFELPLLPHVAVKVIQLSNDAHSSMQDLAKVIMTDQMMTARIIRLSNSPVYGGSMEIKNIKQALVRVGQSEVRNLMLAVSLGAKVFRSGMYSGLAKSLWQHAVGTAFAGRVVAHGLRADKETAFLAGLMHDLGKMIMLNILETCQRKQSKGFMPAKNTILELWNQYHRHVGEVAVAAWKLPDVIQRVIRYHENLDTAGEKPERMIAIIQMADLFSRMHGVGQPAESQRPEKSPAAKMLNLSPDACEELYVRYQKTFEQMKGEFM